MDKFIASLAIQTVAVEATVTLNSYTDQNALVKLVTTVFTADQGIDPSTIPGNVTEFDALDSGDPPALVTTVDPPGKSVLWPDPVGGWTFLSNAGTYPVTVSGYRVDSSDGNFLGCQNIPQQIITGPGQSVVIGEIRLPVTDSIFQGL